MIEIKFRAWIKDEEKIIYPNERNYYIRTDGGLFRIVKLSDKKGQNFLSIETEASIMQFTGLLDKNGKEIYEGDILKGRETGCDVRLFTVSWDRDIAGFIPFANYDTDCDQYFEIETCEVIGNIFENPELLTPWL